MVRDGSESRQQSQHADAHVLGNQAANGTMGTKVGGGAAKNRPVT